MWLFYPNGITRNIIRLFSYVTIMLLSLNKQSITVVLLSPFLLLTIVLIPIIGDNKFYYAEKQIIQTTKNGLQKHFNDFYYPRTKLTQSSSSNMKKWKGKVFYGQEPPSGESATTECGVYYQLLAVIYWCSLMENSSLQSTTTNYGQCVRDGRSNWPVAPPTLMGSTLWAPRA